MKKKKAISLKRRGYKFTGTALISLWGGGTRTIQIKEFILKSRKLTHTNIKRSINDGYFGCQAILSAIVKVYDLYDYDFTQYNRTITLNGKQCQEAMCKGIII